MTICFSLKTRIYSGADSLTVLSQYHHKRVAIVTDKFMFTSGMAANVSGYLTACEISVFCDVKPDPDIGIIAAGTKQFADFQPEVMIALGGGSSLDAAKGILATLQQLRPEQAIELIAIPTTSGSGSEVTCYAVISDPQNGAKYPLIATALQPDIAILDPQLVLSVPQSVSVDTGMDVLTHAIEAYVSLQANDFSDAMAEKAIRLVNQYLPQVHSQPLDLHAREKMHNAACMAGMAFNTAGLGLVHGMAHAIGGLFHIPHGKINAMLLPLIIAFNAKNHTRNSQRYADCAYQLGIVNSAAQLSIRQLILKINTMNRMMGIAASLKQLGFKPPQVRAQQSKIVDMALNDGCTKTNPKPVDAQAIIHILDQLIGE